MASMVTGPTQGISNLFSKDKVHVAFILGFSRLGELMSDVVNKYGIVWVVSGSNHGPALSTVGTPPAISSTSLIG